MPKPALLIIDMQDVLVKGSYEEHEVVDRIANLARRARAAGHPVIYVQHCHASFKPMMKGQPGWRIDGRLEPLPGDVVIEKEASDSFYQTKLEETVREHGIDTLIVTGMQTEYCVDATCRSALSHGLDVVLVADGHTTGDSSLPAKHIIQHHNTLLSNLAHPRHKVILTQSSDVLP